MIPIAGRSKKINFDPTAQTLAFSAMEWLRHVQPWVNSHGAATEYVF